MNRIGMLTVLLVVALAGNVLASESMSIQVSCTIPAIPGVNAPLVSSEEATTGLPQDLLQAEPAPVAQAPRPARQKPSPMLLAETTQGSTLTQTVYSR